MEDFIAPIAAPLSAYRQKILASSPTKRNAFHAVNTGIFLDSLNGPKSYFRHKFETRHFFMLGFAPKFAA